MAEYDADVIVVGSGSLGGFVALEVAKAGKSVIILESGPRSPNGRSPTITTAVRANLTGTTLSAISPMRRTPIRPAISMPISAMSARFPVRCAASAARRATGPVRHGVFCRKT